MSKGFLPLSAAVFIFSFINHVNFHEIFNFLQIKGFASGEIDHIEVMQILAATIGGIILTQVINSYSRKKILIISQTIYFASLICLITIEYRQILLPNLMCIYLSYFVFYSVALMKFMSFFKNKIIAGLIIYFSLWSFAALLAELFVKFAKDIGSYEIFTMLTFMQSLAILSVYFFVDHTRILKSYQPHLTPLLKAIELEVITGFLIAYIIFSLYWDSELFIENSANYSLKIEQIRTFMIVGILLSLYPAKLLIENCNKYKINMYLVLGFLVNLTIFSELGSGKYSNIMVHITNGAILYTLFINNIVILTEKFIEQELDYAITIFLSISMIGSYIGIIATDNMMETYGNSGFLISLYSIAIFFLLYYLLQFFVRRLYRK